MINAKGIIQNNKTASDFIRKQRKFNQVYRILDKEEERAMIEQYARLKLDESGKPIFRTESSSADKDDAFECEFEWIGDETELRLKLAMHNLQAVTRLSTKHCQDTRDYDEMYAKGLYGLTRAANMFHPFKLITKTVGHKLDESGRKVPIKEPVLDKDGNYGFIKFNTYAQFWIFKYIVDEFYSKSIQIDNNSVSINELVRMNDGESKNLTLENYLTKSLAPEVEPPPTVADELTARENVGIYDTIHEYIENSNELSAVEKDILEKTFYSDGGEYIKNDGTANIKKLSSVLKIPQQLVIENQMSALGKLKDFLYEEYGIESLSDVM